MEPIERIVLNMGLVSPEDVERAKSEAARVGRRLAPMLVDLDLIDERALASAMAHATGLAVVEPLVEPDARTERTVPGGVARQFEVIPQKIEGEMLYVAMIDPTDTQALSALRAVASGREIEPIIGLRQSVAHMVEAVYPEALDGDVTLLPRRFGTFGTPGLAEAMPPLPPLPPPVPEPVSEPVPQPPPAPTPETAPFEYGNETIARIVGGTPRSIFQTVAAPYADELASFGTPQEDELGTMFARNEGPPPGTFDPGPSPVSGKTEERLAEIVDAIRRLERRFDSIEQLLSRILTR